MWRATRLKTPMPDGVAVRHAGEGAAGPRALVKGVLARLQRDTPATGATLLIYHRIGGGTRDELDLPSASFARHVEMLRDRDVVSLDAAIDRLEAGHSDPGVVLTFDDGFDDVYRHAWPLLKRHAMPFTVYLATAFVAAPMRWEGSTAKGTAGRGLSWDQLVEMVDSGLCTVGNHTHNHVPPAELTEQELDLCTTAVERHLGVSPRHFTYPWGIPVAGLEPALRARFRSASTGAIGRNGPGDDLMQLRRVPVRRTDPDSFFAAKLDGALGPERTYAGLVRSAKAVGLSG
jgi:peptidoglycan/xylan/chitin deacetylase (PgdA/CDA1 family)